jgi:peptide/nickel transport system ATP-binding protein
MLCGIDSIPNCGGVESMPGAPASLLEVDRLNVVFASAAGERRVLDDVSLSIAAGDIVAVVGESGSGKTLLARSILRLWPAGARCTGGSILLEGTDLLAASEAEMQRVRGARVGMVFQEPLTSLNPALKVGFQLTEGLKLHTSLSRAAMRARVLAMLETIGLPDPETCLERYPHEFSGGMRQRIMIASVLALRPRLLIADEPTTALDAVIARQVLESLLRASQELGAAVLLVSHDLGAVCRYANRVVVMRGGHVVESGPTSEILLAPKDPYTRALLEALPFRRPRPVPPTSEPIAELRSVSVGYKKRALLPWRASETQVLRSVSLQLGRGETLAVVGESGSGKTTLGRALLGLAPLQEGSVELLGTQLSRHSNRLPLDVRRRAQLVFQDPFSSLDPRMRVGDIIDEALRGQSRSAAQRRQQAQSLLQEVGLAHEHAARFPHELSGGQRQRVGIARALATQPSLIVADEPVSALDVTVQAQVLALLDRLQKRFGFALLFVSHDLGVVAQVADRIAILQRGVMVEWGPADGILTAPRHPYTRALWAAAPRLTKTNGGYALASECTPEIPAPNGWQYAQPDTSPGKTEHVELAPGHFALCSCA